MVKHREIPGNMGKYGMGLKALTTVEIAVFSGVWGNLREVITNALLCR